MAVAPTAMIARPIKITWTRIATCSCNTAGLEAASTPKHRMDGKRQTRRKNLRSATDADVTSEQLETTVTRHPCHPRLL